MRARTATLVAALVSGAAGCGACEPDRTVGPDASPSAVASAAPPPAPAPPAPVPSAATARPPRLPCRVISVQGDVRGAGAGDAGGAPLLIQGLVPTEGWLVLSPGARFVAKDPRTSRETTFRGAGRVRPCVDQAEESWVGAGGFDSTVGAGEAPGAEEWVATPFGVVRYNAGRLGLDVRARDAALGVASGTAFVWVPDDVMARAGDGGAPAHTDDGWVRVEPGSLSLKAGPAAPLEAARMLSVRCETLGQAARDLAATLLAGGADASTAIAQVTTRRQARAACAVAGVRVEALPPSDAVAALVKSLAAGNAAWGGLPPP